MVQVKSIKSEKILLPTAFHQKARANSSNSTSVCGQESLIFLEIE